jgi:hypothetical protein
LPRDVFFTFVGFVADFGTGFNGVPAASALSFCFLVDIAGHDFPSSRFQNGAAFVSIAGVAAGGGAVAAAGAAAAVSGSTLEVSVMFTPSILRTKPPGRRRESNDHGRAEKPLGRITSYRVLRQV